MFEHNASDWSSVYAGTTIDLLCMDEAPGDYDSSWDSWDYSGDDESENYDKDDAARSTTIYVVGTVVGVVIIGVLMFCICQECLLSQFQPLL